MELIVKEIQLPGTIEFNYEELKTALTERVNDYKTIVYTADSIKTAKADRAKLNSLKKSINDERIRIEREYMEPFMDFKNKAAELCGIVDDAAKAIDKQVKEYEELQKKEKYEAIRVLFEAAFSDLSWVQLDNILDDKWLNTSVSLKKIDEALNDKKTEILGCLEMLKRLKEFSFEATEVYKETLNIESAWREADKLTKMAEAKKQAEAAKIASEAARMKAVPEPANNLPPEPEKQEKGQQESRKTALSFRVFCTLEEAVKLSNFLREEGIEFERI